MNALRRQEYARAREEENALRRLFSTKGLDTSSPQFLNRLYEEAPGLAPGVEKNILERGKTAAEIEYKQSQSRREAADALNKKLELYQQIFNPLAVTTEEQAGARTATFYDDPDLAPYAAKMMTKDQAIAASKNLFRTNKDAWVRSQLTISGDKILEATERREKDLRARAEKDYGAYQVREYAAGREPMPQDQFIAQRMAALASGGVTTAPSAPGAVTTPPTAPEAAPGAAETMTPEGEEKSLPPVTTSQRPSLLGPNVHPLVPELIAADNKDMATIVQEGYKASGALRQIQDTLAEIERLEDEKPRGWENRRKVLRDYLKVVSTEGSGTNVKVNVPVSVSTEKNFGEKFAGNIADQDVRMKEAAEGAPEAAATANRVLSILQSGQVFTGTGANVKLQMAKLLKLGGGNDSEAIANTEVLISSLANTTLGSIKSSGLGSGQGFTDKDREFLEKAKAGQITYDAASLRQLAELAHRAAQASADKWNKRVKQIPSSAIEGTGISIDPITVPPMFKTKSRNASVSTIKPPAVGTVQDGYKFKGGDPADQKNWEKVK